MLKLKGRSGKPSAGAGIVASAKRKCSAWKAPSESRSRANSKQQGQSSCWQKALLPTRELLLVADSLKGFLCITNIWLPEHFLCRESKCVKGGKGHQGQLQLLGLNSFKVIYQGQIPRPNCGNYGSKDETYFVASSAVLQFSHKVGPAGLVWLSWGEVILLE